MRILSSIEISSVEKRAMEEIGIPEIVLMENAAAAVFQAIEHLEKQPDKVAVICGRGNNGGDGFACARRLMATGIKTTVFHPADTSAFPPAAATNYKILKKIGADLRPLKKPYDFSGYDLIIDAILGTGLTRSVEGEYKEIIEAANRADGFKLAIDLPSGLSADSPSVAGVVFKADATVTFTAMKICLTMHPARAFCGKINVASITLPEHLFPTEQKTIFSCISNLPEVKRRQPDTHKGNYGHVVIIGGSSGKMGAAYLASLASLKSGAGLVTAIHPADSRACFAKTPEIMTFPINCGQYFTEKDAENVVSFINENKISAVCLGCGIGRNAETAAFVKKIVRLIDAPLIIDADGINALNEGDLESISGKAVITPHLGEFSTLSGKSIEQIKKERPEYARSFAMRHGITLVLKSTETLIASPDGNVTITAYGTPALAKGGSGDCLAGIITTLLASGMGAEESAELACFLIGKSAKLAAEKHGERSVLTSDVINFIGTAFNEL